MIPESRLKEAIAEQPYPLLFVTISGAHLYGFPSPDSDFDLRGVHVLPVREAVGIDGGRETIEISRKEPGLELDLHQTEYDRLRGELQVAFEQSALPEAPIARGAVNELLVRLRGAT